MIKQRQLTVACPCLPTYDQPGRQPQFQWNASYENRIEKPKELCFFKKGEHLFLNCTFHHFTAKSRGEAKLNDSCSHHPSSQSYKLELILPPSTVTVYKISDWLGYNGGCVFEEFCRDFVEPSRF